MPHDRWKGRTTARYRILDALRRWPEMGGATNQELADFLQIRHKMTVSQVVSDLYHEGVITINYGEGLVPVRFIELVDG